MYFPGVVRLKSFILIKNSGTNCEKYSPVVIKSSAPSPMITVPESAPHISDCVLWVSSAKVCERKPMAIHNSGQVRRRIFVAKYIVGASDVPSSMMK